MPIRDNDSLEEGLGKALAGRSGELEANIRRVLGDSAVEECRKSAEGQPGSFQVAFVGSLWLRQFTGEFHGKDATRFSNCPVCHGEGWVFEDRGAAACAACEAGILRLAGDWLAYTRPIGRDGKKRYDHAEHTAEFERRYRHNRPLRERIIAAMSRLEKGSKPAESQEGTWQK